MPAPRRNPQLDDPRSWYQLERWRRLRRLHLRREPLCIECLKEGRVRIAEIVDHIEDHRGNWNAFLTSALQSLCREHHEIKHGRLFAMPVVIGVDGWPIEVADYRVQLGDHPRALDEDEALSDRGGS